MALVTIATEARDNEGASGMQKVVWPGNGHPKVGAMKRT